jgi:hypothetical protein
MVVLMCRVGPSMQGPKRATKPAEEAKQERVLLCADGILGWECRAFHNALESQR